MQNLSITLVDLETKFWQSMVDQETDAALNLLCEPALMVSVHGAMKFDHAGYRKMADQGSMVVKSFEFSGMEVVFPNGATAILSYRVKQGVAPRGSVTWHIAMKPGKRKTLSKDKESDVPVNALEKLKTGIRAKVEHPFRVIKRQFGYSKVRYRGLKNTAQLVTLFALSLKKLPHQH